MTAKFYHLVANPVEFVVAGTSAASSYSQEVGVSSSETVLSGDQTKKLYEDIINEKSTANDSLPSNSKPSPTHRRSRTRKRKVATDSLSHNFTEKDFFRACQAGDIKTAEACIKVSKLDVNSSDAFSWTPLMMAAHEGHGEIVLLLLSHGAEWIDKIDGSGYDARDLACLGGHPDIVDLLINCDRIIKKRKVSELTKKSKNIIKQEKIWCELCKSYYHASPSIHTRETHPTSTVHLISDKSFPPKCHSHFYISNSNKGFQLLRKGGWDGESGLGPDREGQKYPVKTILKRNRLGIGSENQGKAKVTHFGSYDESAVQIRVKKTAFKSKGARKNHAKRVEEKEKQREVNFRRLFH